jgi:hypothetical protein
MYSTLFCLSTVSEIILLKSLNRPSKLFSRCCNPSYLTSPCSIFWIWFSKSVHNLPNIHPKIHQATMIPFVSAIYEGVTKSFQTDWLEWELQMLQLSATRCSCIAILWASLVTFAAITLWVASQEVFIVVYFIINSVQKLSDTPSCIIFMQHTLAIMNNIFFFL